MFHYGIKNTGGWNKTIEFTLHSQLQQTLPYFTNFLNSDVQVRSQVMNNYNIKEREK